RGTETEGPQGLQCSFFSAVSSSLSLRLRVSVSPWRRILFSKLAKVDAPSAGLKNQRLSSSVERSSKVTFSQFSLNSQWQVGGHPAATRFGVDVQSEAFV